MALLPKNDMCVNGACFGKYPAETHDPIKGRVFPLNSGRRRDKRNIVKNVPVDRR